MFKTHTLNVPIELVHLVHDNKLHEALGIYLLLKASCDGHLFLSVEQRSCIMAALGLKDVRTFKKHLDKLIQLNWVGYNKNSRTYYIRSFKTLRVQSGFHKYLSAVFHVSKDAANITEFIQGVLLCFEIKRRMRGRNSKVAKIAGSSALKKGRALHELKANGDISVYIGLSLEKLGELWGVSKSQADRIKKRVSKLKYIKTKAKYNIIHTSSKPDFSLFKNLPSNRIYDVKRRKRNGWVYYEFRERSYDEIISLMEFVNQKSIVRRLNIANEECL
ncbi:hypothetical protein OCK74_21935 [Chitinophagaceae bacterium LB-8]|uniref:Helix-turn-helix domain-containing protein n=1 Tax=Paraflavisolibacter caeni TaxID=2982496 RepID=A0A9X3BIQ8_9BACT|nr:hypothetical protein [Paraflavisolibacter caeni]MCU7551797.1 hypothetical protein [Paraflavisolibacter caeni]